MLHNTVLHVSVHQNHHRAPLFQKSNNNCNTQIRIKMCLTVHLVCISFIPVIFVSLLRSFIFKEKANTNDNSSKTAKDSLFIKLHTQQWNVIYNSMWSSVCASLCSAHRKKPCHIKLLSFTASFPTTQKITESPIKEKSVNKAQESHYYLLRELTETLIQTLWIKYTF